MISLILEIVWISFNPSLNLNVIERSNNDDSDFPIAINCRTVYQQ